MVLTPHLQEQIRTMRTAGVTYSKISEFLDLNVNSVKSWCRRNNIEPDVYGMIGVEPEGVGGVSVAQPATSKMSAPVAARTRLRLIFPAYARGRP